MAFRKSGIWPLNRNAIEDTAYAPAKNTSSRASMPIPVTIPDWLVPNEPMPPRRATIDFTEAPHTNPAPTRFTLAGIPAKTRANATKAALQDENQRLRALLCCAKTHMEEDHALKVLMEDENERIRKELHSKKERATRQRAPAEGEARLLTSDDHLEALARHDWKKKWNALLADKDTKLVFKKCRQAIQADEDAREEEAKITMKEQQKRAKEAEKEAKRHEKEAEKLRKAAERRKKAEEKKQETARLAAEKKARADFDKAMNKASKPKKRTKATPAQDNDYTFPSSIADMPKRQPLRPKRAIRNVATPSVVQSNDLTEEFSKKITEQGRSKTSSEAGVVQHTPGRPRTRRQRRAAAA